MGEHTEQSIKTFLENVFRTHKNEQKKLKKSFNAFDTAQIGSEETRHSAIIATLLDPQSPFGEGAESLKAFFRQVGLNEIANLCNEKTRVSTEYSISGRRMDIVIQSDPVTRFCVVIENKTVTVDHERQLEDYQAWLDKQNASCKKLLYLTYNGDDAKNFQGDYERISYRTHICNWLRECALMQHENTAKSVFCSQYCNFITNTLLEGKRKMDEDVLKAIIENFEAAIKVCRNIDETKAFLLDKYFTKQFTKEDGFEVVETDVEKIKTGRGLDYNVIFFDPLKRYEISLGFDHYYFWGSRTWIHFKDLSNDDIKKIKASFDSEESPWKIEKSPNSLILGNHHTEIVLDDDFFCKLANASESIRAEIIKEKYNQYKQRKNEAVELAEQILASL